ncbi:MAG: DUF2244 domain-containing protein [Ochrobactrum anthropi]|uniref:DUF2244 domain-containing protein n=1 Tax=Brucella anthropi TaxID=529 RepID=A0A8I0N710_BRUAN|nr:DUF2244 domain-containing protein [Brucella anthropi]MBE0562757.1 DUF2244 domain-containing protein [Brucella anthropi]
MVSVPTTRFPTVLFHSVLRPRRSTRPRQTRIVLALVAGLIGLAGFGFGLAGAWPVIGFGGLEVGLFYAALRFHQATGRSSETLRLTERELTVTRIGRRGRRQRWSFRPYWVRVSVRHAGNGGVELCSHGRSLVVGTFLGVPERERLAADLRCALTPLAGGAPVAAPRPGTEAAGCTPCRPAEV